MPIPIKTKQGDEHPTPREDMYKGMEYRNHMELYNCLNKICRDPKHQITEQITLVKQQLETLENTIIDRTKNNITLNEQNDGKLVQRFLSDSHMLNEASTQFFDIILQVCRLAGLCKKVPIINNKINHTKAKDISSGKIIPGVAALPISQSLDEAHKHARSLYQ